MSWTERLLIATFLLYSFSQIKISNTFHTINADNNRNSSYRRCDDFHFKCTDNKCIPNEKYCNRYTDCSDGSDEYSNCTELKFCQSYEFQCRNRYCVYNNKLCDGVDDCLDNSDEISCEIDPCQKNSHLCDQLCVSNNNSYICLCEEGYELQNDNKTCKMAEKQGESTLIYATNYTISALSLTSMHNVELVTGLNDILAVSVDALHVYWSVETNGMNAIYRSLKYQNQPQAIITTGLGYVEEIAIDWITTNIYFIDSLRVKFGVCTNNGSYCTVILRGHHENPSGLALDPANGIMYWSEWRLRNGFISKANMDGTNQVTLVQDGVGHPQALAIDVPKRRLYWVDSKLRHIESVDLDGTNRQKIMNIELIYIHSIAILEDRLYWSNYQLSTIESCNKFTGEDHTTLRREIDRIRGMHIYHPLLKPNLTNPCKFSNCSELCLLAGNNNYTCACSLEKDLSEDGHTCRVRDEEQYLMVATNSIFFNYYGDLIGRPTIVRNKLFNHFTAITYDSLNHTILVNDLLSSMIYRYDIKTGEIEPLDDVKNQHVGGMTFDYIGNNLYWCNTHKNSIEIYNLKSNQRTRLRFIDQPRNILVIPESGVMVIAFCKKLKCRLDKLSMSGTSAEITLVEATLRGPQISLVYDTESERIFWADEGTGNIESIFINGTNRELLHSGLFEPLSIAILKDRIYWTLRNDTRLFASVKHLTKQTRRIDKVTFSVANSMETLHLITINEYNRTPQHPCEINNGNCSHICLVSSPDLQKCVCPNGFVQHANSLSCTAPRACDDKKEFRCLDNSCISIFSVCDKIGDCFDLEDEANCSRQVNRCPHDEFQCYNGVCTSKYNLCDGKDDCGDSSDEVNCSHYNCVDTTNFKCVSSGLCIPLTWHCDGQKDCEDGSDERVDCLGIRCPLHMDLCGNDMCLDHTLGCNYVDDCGDKSDETYCSSYERGTQSTEHCEIDQYRCFDSTKCISRSQRCDKHQDCPNNDDEHYCSSCETHQYVCYNYNCITKTMVCDGYDDCGDKSDEEFCDENGKIHEATNFLSNRHFDMVTMNISKFTCNNRRSLAYDKVCDGVMDCADGSDEGGECSSACSKDNPCEQLCEESPKGPVCLCTNGYKLKADNKSCEDIDECALGMCSQICKNKEGSFQCDCLAGFTLRFDGRSCKIIDNTTEIITATAHDIRKITNNLREVDILQRIDNKITGIDYNVMENLLYWSDEESSEIIEVNLRTRISRLIYDMGKPNFVTVDWVTSNIYFFDNKKPYSIKACTRWGYKCATIVKLKNPGKLMAMTVNPIHGFIYWAQTIIPPNDNPTSKIYRSDMNGDNIITIGHGKIGIVTGIAVHYDRKKLFWTDFSQNQIMTSNLDGSNRQVFRHVRQPTSLSVYEDSIYFVMGSTRVIYGCPFHKIQCQPIPVRSTNIDDFLVISHITYQPYMFNFCEHSNCNWMCAIKNEAATCICPDDVSTSKKLSCIKDVILVKNSTTNNTIETLDNSDKQYFILIILMVIILIALIVACYIYRNMIFDKCRSVRESASVSFQNTSSLARRNAQYGDDSLPMIPSCSKDWNEPTPDRHMSTKSPSDYELVQLHLPKRLPSNPKEKEDGIIDN